LVKDLASTLVSKGKIFKAEQILIIEKNLEILKNIQ